MAACAASMYALGLCAIVISNARAGPVGFLRPCSQPCNVRTLTPHRDANVDWPRPHAARMAATSTSRGGGGINNCDGVRAREIYGFTDVVRFQYLIRQIVPLASSDTRSAPSCATATPTGLPHTSESLMTNPVRKSWYTPVGDPSFRRTRMTL
jgi:hypothetical protein